MENDTKIKTKTKTKTKTKDILQTDFIEDSELCIPSETESIYNSIIFNPQHEIFVQGLIRGFTKEEAYKNAYPNNIKDCTSKSQSLFLRKDVQFRFQQLINIHFSDVTWRLPESVKSLKYLLNICTKDLTDSGLSFVNSNAYLRTIEELNKVSGLYNIDKKDDSFELTVNNFSISDFLSNISPNYYDIFNKIITHKFIHYVFTGGRGSLKSSFISFIILYMMVEDSDCNVVILRKVGGTLRDSVYSSLLWVINTLNLNDKFICNVSPMEIKHISSGRKILFKGCDNPEKLKSIKVPFGKIKICWYEEVSEFSSYDEILTINQSLIRGSSDFLAFYSYNAPRSKSNWVNYEMSLNVSNRVVFNSTYLEAPPEWLGENFLIEANLAKERGDGSYYRHKYLNEIIGDGVDIFNNIVLRTISDSEINSFINVYGGIDWGFAVDPCHFSVCGHDISKKKVYVFFEIHKTHLSNLSLANLIIDSGFDKLFIIADNSEPKSISELKVDYGLHVFSCIKGKGSVDFGMKYMTNTLVEIVIDPIRCPNTAREFTHYNYPLDKNNNIVSLYPDKNNHSIDAVRYSITHSLHMLKKNNFSKGDIVGIR
jgi:phage terminase large subunit